MLKLKTLILSSKYFDEDFVKCIFESTIQERITFESEEKERLAAERARIVRVEGNEKERLAAERAERQRERERTFEIAKLKSLRKKEDEMGERLGMEILRFPSGKNRGALAQTKLRDEESSAEIPGIRDLLEPLAKRNVGTPVIEMWDEGEIRYKNCSGLQMKSDTQIKLVVRDMGDVQSKGSPDLEVSPAKPREVSAARFRDKVVKCQELEREAAVIMLNEPKREKDEIFRNPEESEMENSPPIDRDIVVKCREMEFGTLGNLLDGFKTLRCGSEERGYNDRLVIKKSTQPLESRDEIIIHLGCVNELRVETDHDKGEVERYSVTSLELARSRERNSRKSKGTEKMCQMKGVTLKEKRDLDLLDSKITIDFVQREG